MLRTVKVYGELAEFLGRRTFQAAVRTPAEAVRFLLANFPKLESHMAQGHYRVSVGREVLPLGEDPGTLHLPSGQAEIRIVPVLTGAGVAGRIIAGVALIAASILFAPAGALAGGLFTLGSQAVPIVAGIGFSLALGGVAQLLTPTPRLSSGNDSDNDPRKSYSFSGIQNVSRQGVPVPIIYGEVLTGSVVVSAAIRVEKI